MKPARWNQFFCFPRTSRQWTGFKVSEAVAWVINVAPVAHLGWLAAAIRLQGPFSFNEAKAAALQWLEAERAITESRSQSGF